MYAQDDNHLFQFGLLGDAEERARVRERARLEELFGGPPCARCERFGLLDDAGLCPACQSVSDDEDGPEDISF